MKGYRVENFSPEIQRGIRLHQYIDTFTDDHQCFRQSKRRIASDRRRYSGVLIDIFYDHFLATSWSDYSGLALSGFTQKVYQLLETNFEQLPGRLKRITPVLIREDWLMGYGTDIGLARTFSRLSQRIRRQNTVDQSLQDLRENREQLYQDFCLFFPDLQSAVDRFRESSSES